MELAGDPTAPVACTLTTKEAAAQVLEWTDLHGRSTGAQATEAGVVMTFPAGMAHAVEDLARREASCCAFLSMRTTVEGDVLSLEISSERLDALPVIDRLAGVSRF